MLTVGFFFSKIKNHLSRLHKSEDTVVLEGKRLILDAFKAGFYPEVFLFSRLILLADIPFDKSKNLAMYQMSYRNISAWSDLKTSPGLLGKLR